MNFRVFIVFVVAAVVALAGTALGQGEDCRRTCQVHTWGLRTMLNIVRHFHIITNIVSYKRLLKNLDNV